MLACSRRHLCTHACPDANRWSSRTIHSRRQAEAEQRRLGLFAFIYDPEYWRGPFQRFMFKFGVIFFGIWLLLVAIAPIGPFFSPIHLFGVTFWIGEAPPNVSTSTILHQSP